MLTVRHYPQPISLFPEYLAFTDIDAYQDLLLNIADCKNETTVKNGKVTYGNLTIFGELAEVTCDTGYKLDGHPYLICQEDGKWNSNTTCVTVGKEDVFSPMG